MHDGEHIQEERTRPGPRGRPKGTGKPDEERRQQINVRLSSETHRMIRDGLAHGTDPTLSNKTDFIERAISYYYQMIAHSPAEEAVQAATQAASQTPEEPQALIENQHIVGDEGEEGDYIDHLLDLWARERPDLDFAELALFMRFQRAAQFVEAELARLCMSYGIALRELLLLAALRRSGAPFYLTPTELLQSLLITPGAITKQVDRLTALGLVARHDNPDDRRKVFVYLTPHGRELTDAVMTSAHTGTFTLFSSLSSEERQLFSSLLRTLLRKREQFVPATIE